MKKKLPEDLTDEGKLVYAVVRKYKGGRYRRLILHEATIGSKKSFFYGGGGKTWTAGIKDLKEV